TFVLPLAQTNGWQFLKYRKIPSNTFHCTPTGLVIGVTNSAAPAVFPLTNELSVVKIRVRGTISGSLKVPPGKQGQKGFDDFVLRVGLVEPGTHTLSWWQKRVAADWVKKLFSLTPSGKGISKIHFFNVGTDAAQIGRNWTYNSGVPMEQTVVAVPDAGGFFTFTNSFAKPLDVIAIWISSDGDDTHSSFSITLSQAQFTTANAFSTGIKHPPRASNP
ncbi:MAG TPA: hypothetical protein VFF11_10555, partial [Candidatus Binatia bacterium]|nr:hypothetical protein [Candidatus Binatia bacterium]